ncbi:hypothetical protein [Archangium violaceum]|uniref:hypothetical protein n=1 Tax=Archangium violaceum TaxID=83451 RepID=UPI0012698A7A|nr:hypothetical protein [Archangium violaceum]
MNRWPLWAVLAPVEPAQMESRARAALSFEEDKEDGKEPSFELIRGSGRYHAIVGTDPLDLGAELRIAKALSLELDEPVYSVERAKEPWAVTSWRNGALEVEEANPEALAKSLGCPLPGSTKTSSRTARKPLRTVALIEGVQAEEARRALEKDYGEPLRQGRFHLEDTPRGALLAGTTGGISFADITASERLPHVKVYGVTASPRLDMFSVTVLRGGDGIERFTRPLRPDPCVPEVSEIKGESTPERILSALGIPAEWFLNE